MAETKFKKIPSLLEEMTATWEKINSPNPESVKVNKSDLEVIRRAFISAAKYEGMNDRWNEAYNLFLDKHLWPRDQLQTNTRNALRKASVIMGFIEDKRTRFHSQRDREIYEHYTWYQTFCFKDKDGNYYDEEGEIGNEKKLKIKLIEQIQMKYGFKKFRAVVEYLRDIHGLKNLVELRDHKELSS
jgi:hypothetical protein